MAHAKKPTSSLEQELLTVAKSSLALDQLGMNDTMGLPVLREIATTIYPNMPPQEAVGQALRDALQALPNTKMPRSQVTWRRAAEVLMGSSAPRLVDTMKTKAYDQRLEALLSEAGLQDLASRSRGRISLAVRTKLAIELDKLGAENLDLTGERERDTSAPRFTKFTVRRTKLESQLAKEIRRSGFIKVHGEAGNGKRHLAEQVVRQAFPATRILTLRGPAEEKNAIYQADLMRALSLIGSDAGSWDLPTREHRIRTEIHEGSNYDVACLFGFSSEELELISDYGSPRIPVLVTGLAPDDDMRNVRVGAFDEEEVSLAIEYLTYLGLERSDSAALCYRLGNKPVAISLIVQVIESGLLETQKVLEACKENIGQAYAAASDLLPKSGVDWASQLHNVYRATVDQIRLKDRASLLEVLSFAVWITGNCTVDQLVDFCFAGDVPSALQEMRLHADLQTLSTYGLLQYTDSEIAMNNLTQFFLREVMSDSFSTTLDSVVGQFFESLVESVKDDKGNADWLGITSRFWKMAGVEGMYLLQCVFHLLHGPDIRTIDWDSSTKVGLFYVGSHNWLVLQSNFAWFEPSSSDGFEAAIIEVDQTGLVLWSNSASPTRMTRLQAALFLNLVEVYGSSATAVYPSLATRRVTLSLVPSASDDTQHIPAASHPSPLWSACSDLPIWAICGSRFVANFRSKDELASMRQCEACNVLARESASTLLDNLLAWRTLAYEFRKRDVQVHLTTLVSIESTIGFLLLERESSDQALIAFNSAISNAERAVAESTGSDLERAKIASLASLHGKLSCRGPVAARTWLQSDVDLLVMSLSALAPLDLRTQVYVYRDFCDMSLNDGLAMVGVAVGKAAVELTIGLEDDDGLKVGSERLLALCEYVAGLRDTAEPV